MKHNPMSINRGFCSLEKLTLQNQKLERNTRNSVVIRSEERRVGKECA